MEPITPLLISLTGILFGYILTHIAPEELKPGKKYFIILKRVVYVVFAVTVVYFLGDFLAKVIFSLLFIVVLVIEFKFKPVYKEIIIYLSLIIPYFFIEEKLIIASLIFVYGLPLGTLLRKL